MRTLCKYPVRKWKDIPKETQERIRQELLVPLPPHLIKVPTTLKIREKKNNFPLKNIVAWSSLIFLILLFLLLYLK